MSSRGRGEGRGAAEVSGVGEGRDVRPGTRRNWLICREDGGLRLVLVLVLLPIVTMHRTRGDTRGMGRKIKKRRELFLHERGSYLFIYPARPPAYSS